MGGGGVSYRATGLQCIVCLLVTYYDKAAYTIVSPVHLHGSQLPAAIVVFDSLKSYLIIRS